MEFSTLYGWGSNQQTPLIDIKSLGDLELMMTEGNYSDEKARLIEETYNKLKNLLNNQDIDPPDTPEGDPPALDDMIRHFYVKLKI
jgi:hypothetical protein